MDFQLEQTLIAEGRRSLREIPRGNFLNNFRQDVLPEDQGRWFSGRDKEKYLGGWDKKLHDVASPERAKAHSELRLSQTGREFYATIDQVIAELDTDGLLRKAIDRYCRIQTFDERGPLEDELEERLIPIFARLVAMGYSCAELRG
jgi:hypothetical protein